MHKRGLPRKEAGESLQNFGNSCFLQLLRIIFCLAIESLIFFKTGVRVTSGLYAMSKANKSSAPFSKSARRGCQERRQAKIYELFAKTIIFHSSNVSNPLLLAVRWLGMMGNASAYFWHSWEAKWNTHTFSIWINLLEKSSLQKLL